MTTNANAVARYRSILSYGLIEAQEHPAGSFVLFTDHERVVAEWQAGAAATMFRMTDALDKQVEELRAELAAKSKDAERYAWLRERAGQDDDFVEIFIDNESYAPGHLDAQIDQAMGEENGR